MNEGGDAVGSGTVLQASRKVAGSIPDDVTGIQHFIDRTMV
jgi:hypothetical protein